MNPSRARATTTVDRQAAQKRCVSSLATLKYDSNNVTHAPFDILIGHASVIHPFAELDATKGPIHIGDYCIISERCCIRHPGSTRGEDAPPPMVIGNCNYFGPSSHIQAIRVGDGNTFQSSSSVGIMTEVGNYCTIQSTCRVTHDCIVPDKVIVFGESNTWAKRPNLDEEEEKDKCRQMCRFFRAKLPS